MKNLMHYKGYIGSVEFSEEDQLFFGKVQGIRALLSYEGKDAEELVADFHAAIDDYLTLCRNKDVAPETAYKGSFNVRISPVLHQELAEYAMEHQTTLNHVAEEAMEQYVTAVRQRA